MAVLHLRGSITTAGLAVFSIVLRLRACTHRGHLSLSRLKLTTLHTQDRPGWRPRIRPICQRVFYAARCRAGSMSSLYVSREPGR